MQIFASVKLYSIVSLYTKMTVLEVVMSVVFGLSAAYIIWCLYKATRYMREHPDEFNMSDSYMHINNQSKNNK